MNKFIKRKRKELYYLVLLFIVGFFIFTASPNSYAEEEPLQGQIIVDPNTPRWLVYNKDDDDDGKLDPFFMCGPGDPEGFLYRGSRNSDGTRDGDQLALIQKLIDNGGNSIYMQAIRTHGGDAQDNTENPFNDYTDSKSGINQAILNQWEEWFTLMDNSGIVIFLFLYDDAIQVGYSSGLDWPLDGSGNLSQYETDFIDTLVNKFENHKNLIFVVMEEVQEMGGDYMTHAPKTAEEIRLADDHNHVIAVHQLAGLTFKFPDDPNIDQFAIQSSSTTAAALHDNMVTAWNNAQGKYNNNMSEAPGWGTGVTARKKNWAAAMGGAYIMVLGMDIANTSVSDLQDCGRQVEFFESTKFNEMAPHDEFANGGTEYVLADPGNSYIAYASNLSGDIGLKSMIAGTYDFKWLDAVNGNTAEQTITIDADGDYAWQKPGNIGVELAVYIEKQQDYEQVGLYGIFKHEFTAAQSHDNPYLDVDMTAYFESPSQDTLSIPCFWDGGNTWMVHFSPNKEGNWSYTTSCDDDTGLNGQGGSFTVANTGLKGGVMLMPDYPLHMQYQDGTPYYMHGETEWGLGQNRDWNYGDEYNHDKDNVYKYMETRANQEFNYIHANCGYNGWVSNENDGGESWQTDDPGILINPAHYKEIQERIEYLNSNNITFGFMLNWSNPVGWMKFETVQQRQKYIDYVAGRFSAYNVMFIVSGEYDEYPYNYQQNYDLYDSIGTRIAEQDPHDRMIAIHPATGEQGSTDFADEDWMSFGDYTQLFENLNATMIAHKVYNKPVVNSEYGYYLTKGPNYQYSDKLWEIRYSAWDIVMAGAYCVTGFGSTYGAGNHWPAYQDGKFDIDTAQMDAWEEDSNHVLKFFTDHEWWKLTDANASVTGSGTKYALREIGKQYLIYHRGSGTSISVALGTSSNDNTTYSVSRFSPRTGDYTPLNDYQGAGPITLSIPSGPDGDGQNYDNESTDWTWSITSIDDGSPQANFSGAPTSGYAPLTVTFKNESTGDYSSCLWEFGDDETSSDTSEYLTHVYDTAETYTVSLTVTNANNQSSTKTIDDYITATENDTTPPTISIITPENDEYFNYSPITISGSASDDSGIASVYVNGELASTTNGFATWTAQVALTAQGSNQITAIATDASENSNTNEASINVNYDSENPVVTIQEPEEGYSTSDSTITVSGTASSDTDSINIYVNDEITYSDSNNDFTNWSAEINLGTSYGSKVIKVVVTDSATNQAQTSVTITYNSEQVGLYGIFEQEFTADGNYSNPYADVTMTATFIRPSDNAELTIPCFWDGGSIWKVRFSPDETGNWSYTTTCTDPYYDSGLDNQSGSFTVVDTGLKGGIKARENFPYHMQYQNGEPYYMLGDTEWGLVKTKDWPGNNYDHTHDTVFHYIDVRYEQGFTYIHGNIGYDAWIPDTNEGGAQWNGEVGVKVNPGYFQEIDGRVEYLNSKGITFGLMLNWASPQGWTAFTEPERELYIDYVVARFSAYNVIFIESGEYDEYPSSGNYDYHNTIGTRIGSWDHNRMITTHPATIVHGS
ncbi:MAG: DUF4038 domain-containing protein, partial [Candidatus Margulisiibacteriota bacterium]